MVILIGEHMHPNFAEDVTVSAIMALILVIVIVVLVLFGALIVALCGWILGFFVIWFIVGKTIYDAFAPKYLRKK